MRLAFLLFFTLGLSLFFAGCGGSHSSSVGPIKSIALSPSTVSLNPGEVQQMQISALDSNGTSVLNQTFTFNSTSNAIQVATNGQLCAGSWDSLATPVNCTPANPSAAGLSAVITANAQGVTSNNITAFVHQPVASITITQGAPPSGTPTCSVSVNGTMVTGVPQNVKSPLTAKAFNASNVDITKSVGTFLWNSSDASIGSLGDFQDIGSNNITSKLPGTTQVVASVGTQTTITSLPVNFVECPVATIEIGPDPVTKLTSSGKTQQMSTIVLDSVGKKVSGIKSTWTSSQPTVATVNTAGVATAAGGGTTAFVLACTPDTCNKGLNIPIYSNVATATVPGVPATTTYVTCSTTHCPATPKLIPIDTSKNTAGTAITLPHTPNSLLIGPNGTTAFLGSNAGVMLVDLASATVTKTVTIAPGTVLAASPDSNMLLVSNPADPGGPQITLLNISANSVTTFSGNATGASFTPDGLRAYVAAGNNVLVVQASKGLVTIPVGAPVNDISVLGSGAAAFAAASNTPFVNTCTEAFNAGTGGSPTLVKGLPNGADMLGVDTSGLSLFPVSGTCPATVAAPKTVALGAAFTTPNQIIVTPDSKHVYITSDAAGVLLSYDVTAGTATPLALSDNTVTTFTGGTTMGSDIVYVGASDNKVHAIHTSDGKDFAQVSVSVEPDLVAVRP